MKKLELDSKGTSFEQLIYFVTGSLKFIEVPANKILFKTGDLGDNMFVIAQGTVMIFKPIDMRKEMTIKEYFKELKDKFDRKDIYSVNKTIELNKEIIDLHVDDLHHYDKIRFLVKNNRKLLNLPSIPEINHIFELAPYSLEEFNIDVKKKFESKITEESYYQERIRSYLTTGHASFIVNNYAKLEKEHKVYSFLIVEEEKFMEMNTFEHFGDYSLGSTDHLRKATVVTKTPCIFGIISKDIYIDHIFAETNKRKMKEIAQLIENYFFQSVNKLFFEKKYFNLFRTKEVPRGEILTSQDDPVDCVYFVRNGEIEISMRGSINSLKTIVEDICSLNKLDHIEVPTLKTRD